MILYKDGHYSYPNGEFPDPPFDDEEVFPQDDGNILILPHAWRDVDNPEVSAYNCGFYANLPLYDPYF